MSVGLILHDSDITQTEVTMFTIEPELNLSRYTCESDDIYIYTTGSRNSYFINPYIPFWGQILIVIFQLRFDHILKNQKKSFPLKLCLSID